MDLQPFQRRFVKAAFQPDIDIACLSLPRTNGKSTLAAWLAAQSMTPGTQLFEPGAENALVSGAMKQARVVFRVMRQMLGEEGYGYEDNNQSMKVIHKGTKTRLTVHGANPKTALGILGARLIIGDEPGAWEPENGQPMWDVLRTTIGKQRMTILLVGTLAPAPIDGWWPRLVQAGCAPGTHVTCLQGDAKTWDRWATIRRANPLEGVNPLLRRTLKRQRDEARRDSRLKAAFLSMRLNVPTPDEAKGLFGVDEWEGVLSRPVPPRSGLPLWGVDLGGSRAWSAVVAVWSTGRVEALAMTAGKPDIAAQEKRDRVPRGMYQAMADRGVLVADPDGKWEPNPARLLELAASRFGGTAGIIADYFKRSALSDVAERRWPVTFRRAGWEDASEDIGGTRRQALDGGIGVAEDSRKLLSWSLSVAVVKPDDRGNVRLAKADQNNRSRNDVASAFVLAAGAVDRARRQAPPRELKVY